MDNIYNVKTNIKNIIQKEIDALLQLKENIDNEYVDAISAILACKGKVIISGIGKSGLIGKKISSTFSSLGIPSVYINANDALHGDLGAITNNDVIILISNSGESNEIINMIPTLDEIGIYIISITRANSFIAKHSDTVLKLPELNEADNLNLAPTCSTTMTLAIGDSLACTISELKGFTKEQFLVSHPSGKLGQMLKESVI